MTSEWQPIETAPRDGTAFLGWFPGRQGYIARQDVAVCNHVSGKYGRFMVNGHTSYGEMPTHWMPLPDAPS